LIVKSGRVICVIGVASSAGGEIPAKHPAPPGISPVFFYKTSKSAAVCPAIAALLTCNMAQNIDIPGCLSGYSRTFNLQ